MLKDLYGRGVLEGRGVFIICSPLVLEFLKERERVWVFLKPSKHLFL
jgi:hypothetical protein